MKFNDLRDQLLKAEAGKAQVNAAQMNEVISKLIAIAQSEQGESMITLLRTYKPK